MDGDTLAERFLELKQSGVPRPDALRNDACFIPVMPKQTSSEQTKRC